MSKESGQSKQRQRAGSERFHRSGTKLPLTLESFWQWAASELVGNTLRGMLAEYLVASALGAADGVRKEWDGHDLELRDGYRVEVCHEVAACGGTALAVTPGWRRSARVAGSASELLA